MITFSTVPIYRSLLVCLILAVAILQPWTTFGQLPNQFQKVELVTGLKNSVNIEFAPDGRIFIIDRYGEIFIYKPATQTTVSAGVLDVFHDMEEGLLAIAFDPQFTTNNFVFIHYSHPTMAKNRVSRFKMNGDKLDLTSEVVVLEWTSDRNGYYHAAGDMDFDSKGNLYIATGDNTNHTPYAALNEKDANQSAERSSSNTNDLRGKILRIKPGADGTYTVPADNLFADGKGGRPEIFVMGARNPYKIYVDKANTDWLFWGEVGPDANVASEKGPEGKDEINITKSAGNYGWPYFAGKNHPYLNTYAQPNYYYDQANPVNISKWNTGADTLPPAQPAWLEFFHGCYLAGPRYYYNAAIENPKKLPSDFHQLFFYYDFNTSKIWVAKLDDNGNLLSNSRFAENVITGSGFIDLKIGPDGQLYILEYGAGCCPNNVGSGKLVRIDYTGIDSNKAPQVSLSASKTTGALPLSVSFSSEGTIDLDGDALTYEWDFQSDGAVDSNEEHPSFVFTEKRIYDVLLRVKDARGAISTKTVKIYAGNHAATFQFNHPPDGGMLSWEDNINYDIVVNDQEDGSTANGTIDCSKLNLIPAFGHLTHSHDGMTINQCKGTFFLDPLSHDAQGQEDIYYIFKVSYTDADGLTSFDQVTVYPKLMEAEFYDQQSYTKLISNSDKLGGGMYSVRALSHDAYIVLEGRNLQNIQSVSYRVASTVGGSIEVRTGSPTGTLISTVAVPVTGSTDNWTTVTAPITNPGGKHDLYFVFKQPGAINLLDLNSIQFHGTGVSVDATPPTIYSIQAVSKSQVVVKFNEALEESTAEAISNYAINNGVTISSAVLQEDKQTVVLRTSPLTILLENQLTVSNLKNASGVVLSQSIVKNFTLDEVLVRINAGGPQVTLNAIQWQANQYNIGGAAGSKPSLAINNTTADEIYQSELYGNFTYHIPVADNGAYSVRLHFAELTYKNKGERVFNVSIENGQASLVNYDIFSKAGYATAIIENFDGVKVEDGTLTITFTGVVKNPKVSAIEVLYGKEAAGTPSVVIQNPAAGTTVASSFNLYFKVENWYVGNANTHIHKMVDGVDMGDVYTTGPVGFSDVPAGNHTFQLVLANADHSLTTYSDQVQLNVVEELACVDNPFPLQWAEHIIGSDVPYRSPFMFAADINGDGYKDIVTGGWWYKNPGTPKGMWTQNIIGAPMNNMFLIYDFDRDGDPDILGTQGKYLSTQLAWAQNDGKGNFTIHTNVPGGFAVGSTYDNTFLAGAATGNFNGVENMQIALVWNGAETHKTPVQMLTVPADPVNQPWTLRDISPNAVGESITAADIDKDGDLDLFQAKNWLRNDNGTWTVFSTGITLPTYYEHNTLADLDGDGVLDGIVTQIGEDQEINWLQSPADPTKAWTKKTLGTDVDSGLSLDVVDMDGDGDLDVLTAEWKSAHRLIAFENDLCNTGTWIKHILHPGGINSPDHHNSAQSVDLDNDGDLDIISVGWDKRTPRIYINDGGFTANQAPVVVTPVADQSAVLGVAFSFTFAENTFSDPDGDMLSYSATQSNGSALPTWLSFNGATRTFSGTPPSSGVSDLLIKLMANDGKGGMAYDEFQIKFSNQPPVVANPIPDQTAAAGNAFSFTFAANTFSDPNGDALTYTATQANDSALPTWLSFDVSTRTFSGTPAAANVGVVEIKVIASDGTFSASDVFQLTIIDGNTPVLANPIVDQYATAGAAFAFTFAENTFSDPNSDPLTYTAIQSNNNALPIWLSFNGATRTFSGTPAASDVGTIEIKVTASDGSASVSDVFSLTVGTAGSIRVNAGGGQLTAYGVPFSADQYFNSGKVYSNTKITDIAGTTDDELYKTERYGAFSYDVPVPSGTYLVRLHFAEIYFGATGGGTGAVGKRVFNVTGEGQPLLTNFDIYAEVGAMTALVKEFEIAVTDGTLNLAFVKVADNPKISAFEIIYKSGSTNQLPIVSNAIPDQTATANTAYSFTFAEGTFSDADGDPLTYTAVLAGGGALPAWLSFEGASRTFSGTPAETNVGTISLQVTAADGKGGTVSDQFDLTVQSAVAVNQAPVVSSQLPDQTATVNTAYSFTFAANTFSDADGDPLTYTASRSDGNALPVWLSFDAGTRTFSGTPAETNVGILSLQVTAADGKGGTVSDQFDLTVQSAVAVNQAPVVSNQLPDQKATVNTAYSFTFAANTFSDADGDALTYTASRSDGTALPVWLSFDAGTRTFSGTPASTDAGTTEVKVTASDGTASVSDVFSLTVETAGSIRVNAGGGQLTAYGVPFSADQYFSGGKTYSNTKITDIAGTTDDALYKTERNNAFSYNVPVPSGTYLVRLHFAEIYFGATGGGTGAVGKRVFNVTGEGQPLLTNFDIYAEVGAMTALVKEFEISVTDGTLNLAFVKVVENPKVSAIEVIAKSSVQSFETTAEQTVVGSPEPVEMLSTISVYPNPFHRSVYLQFQAEEQAQEYEIKVYDVMGRVLHRSNFNTNAADANLYQIELDPHLLKASGLYLLSVEGKDSRSKKVFKLIRE